MDTLGEKIPGHCYRWEDHAMNLVILIRGRQEKLPENERGKRVVECNIENFVPTHYPKDSKCEVCKKTDNTSQVQNKTKEARGCDSTFFIIRRLDQGRSQKSQRGKRVEMRTKTL